MSKSISNSVLLVLSTLGILLGCEQAVINGPVGGAAVTVTELCIGLAGDDMCGGTPVIELCNGIPVDELCIGPPISKSGTLTVDLAEVMLNEVVDFDALTPSQVLTFLGLVDLRALPVEPDKWYLVTVENGYDYAGYPNTGPVEVSGTIHALMLGAQLKAGNFVVGPLSEAAYQWLFPWLKTLSRAEWHLALKELAEALVTDVHKPDNNSLDYDDLLTYNPLRHSTAYIGPAASLSAMRAALADGSSDAAKLAIAEDMAPASAPRVAAEAVFRTNISPNIAQANCIQCHVAGGLAGNTRHVLQRTSNSNHIALNVQMYADLVDAIGITVAISKPQGGAGHGGGQRLAPGSQQLSDFTDFLNML